MRIRDFLDNEKMLLFVLTLQLVVYWLFILGMATKSQFVAYQQF